MGIAERVIAAIENQSRDETTEVAALRVEVEGLKRVVAALIEHAHHPQAAEAALRAAQRSSHEDIQPEMLASAYRGPQPDDGELRCAVCRKAIEADDPELSLESAGRVCMSCYQRSQV